VNYAYPIFGSFPVGDIDAKLVLKAVQPIWQSKNVTASRLRQRLEKVLDYAKVLQYRTGENPATWKGNMSHMLPPRSKVNSVKHFAALPHVELPIFWEALSKQSGMGAEALRFVILTAARTGEVLGATWDEVDLDNKIWIIPATRMKAGSEHRVPLSDPALEILKTAKQQRKGDFVFPGMKAKHPLSNMAMANVLKRMKRTDITVHGFRSTFRDWCAEETSTPQEVAEMALAHTIANKVEAAYRRGDLLEKRVPLMEDWAGYCAVDMGS